MGFSILAYFSLSLGKKKEIKDNWGDVNGYAWLQIQNGSDSKNTYSCCLGIGCVGEYEDIVFFCQSKLKNTIAFHPGHNYRSENISVKFRSGDEIRSFFGKTHAQNISYDEVYIDIQGTSAIGIFRILQQNKNYDVLVEGNGWHFKTKITGNLPMILDNKNSLVVSKDGKTVKGIKSWAIDTLKNISIPLSVEEIADDAFNGCSSLREVKLLNFVKSIGFRAFSGCQGLKKIEIPGSVSKINYEAFANCSNLEEVIFQNELIEIDRGAFNNCTALKSINLKKMLVNENFLLEDNSIHSILNTNAKSYILPKGTEEKELSWFFYQCKDVEDIIIPNTTKIMIIDFDGFYLKNLKSITVPKTVRLVHVPTNVRIIRK